MNLTPGSAGLCGDLVALRSEQLVCKRGDLVMVVTLVTTSLLLLLVFLLFVTLTRVT